MADDLSQYPAPSKAVVELVSVLGVNATIDLLLNFGGSEVYIPHSASAEHGSESELECVLGNANVRLLADHMIDAKFRVPLANRWLAQCLYQKGSSIAYIARRLRIADNTARRYVRGEFLPRPKS